MPYYVFAIKSFAAPEQLAEFDAFKAASTHAKALRVAPDAAAGVHIKIMFADSPLAAEDLLLQIRVAGPSGDE